MPRKGLSQPAFAMLVGLSKGRISQLVREGLPRHDDGSIDEKRAKRWIRDNLDPKRRQAAKPSRKEVENLGTVARLRAHKLERESRLIDITLREKEGELVDRKEVEAAIFSRARYERDAWLGWASAVSGVIADAAGADPQSVFAVLDREVRKHLIDLAETDWKVVADAR